MPGVHFLEIIHLLQGNTESIYSSLVECLKEKNLQISRIVRTIECTESLSHMGLQASVHE